MATVTLDTRAPHAPARKKRSQNNWFIYFIALVLVALLLVPVAYIILGGFRTNSEITVDPAGLPINWQFINYVEVLTNSTFWRQVGNSAITRSQRRSSSSRSG